MHIDLLNRYIWIVDTLNRYGRLTRLRLDELWSKSQFSVRGEGLPRRTFYNYRLAIEEVFGIEILYDSATNEYYIDKKHNNGLGSASVIDWLLNSASTNSVLSNARDIADRVFLEDIPSAREYLDTVMQAVKNNHPLKFDYAPYTRVRPSANVVINPYFLNLFRQRWYVTGFNTGDKKIKTYALDRMQKVIELNETFEVDSSFDPSEYTRNAFGVIFSSGPVHHIVLKVKPQQAKYLRTLPLHHSQREEVNDQYSLFYYYIRITPDFIAELLSMGSSITVVAPKELRLMIEIELRSALQNYSL